MAATYDIALKACAATANPTLARNLVSSMWRQRIPVGRVAQGSLLKALCASGRRAQAFRHLKTIPSSRLTTWHCNTLLSACAAAHDTALGARVWEFMQRRQVEVDAVSWCDALRLCGLGGGMSMSVWGGGVQSLHDVYSKAIAGINTSTNNKEERSMMMSAYAAALATAGHLDASFDACEAVLDSDGVAPMLPQDLDLNLDLTEQQQQLVEAKSTDVVGRRQQASPLDHIRTACNTLIHAAVAAHRWPTMRRVVSLMTSRGLLPDIITYNALLRASLRRGEGSVAMEEGVAELQALGLRPNYVTRALLIEAYAGEGDVDKAHRLLFGGGGTGSNVSGVEWCALLKGYVRVGDLGGLRTAFESYQRTASNTTISTTASSERDIVFMTYFNGIASIVNSLYTSFHPHPDPHQQVGIAEEEDARKSTIVALQEEASEALFLAEKEYTTTTRTSSLFVSPSTTATITALIKAHAALHHTSSVWKVVCQYYDVREDVNDVKKKEQKKPAVEKVAEMEASIVECMSSLHGHHHQHQRQLQPMHAAIPCLLRANRLDRAMVLLHYVIGVGVGEGSDTNTTNNNNEETYAALIAGCVTPLRADLAHSLFTQYTSSCGSGSGSSTTTPTPTAASTVIWTSMIKIECGRGWVDAALNIARTYQQQRTTTSDTSGGAKEESRRVWMTLKSGAATHHRPDVVNIADHELRMMEGVWDAYAYEHGDGDHKASTWSAHAESTTRVTDAASEKRKKGEEEEHWRGYYATDEEDEW